MGALSVRPRRVEDRGLEKPALVDVDTSEVDAGRGSAVQFSVQADQSRFARRVYRPLDDRDEVQVADAGEVVPGGQEPATSRSVTKPSSASRSANDVTAGGTVLTLRV